MKNAIMLKLIDIDNMIDSSSLFINFTNEENFEELKDKFLIG